jgi:hypothetical protein
MLVPVWSMICINVFAWARSTDQVVVKDSMPWSNVFCGAQSFLPVSLKFYCQVFPLTEFWHQINTTKIYFMAIDGILQSPFPRTELMNFPSDVFALHLIVIGQYRRPRSQKLIWLSFINTCRMFHLFPHIRWDRFWTSPLVFDDQRTECRRPFFCIEVRLVIIAHTSAPSVLGSGSPRFASAQILNIDRITSPTYWISAYARRLLSRSHLVRQWIPPCLRHLITLSKFLL